MRLRHAPCAMRDAPRAMRHAVETRTARLLLRSVGGLAHVINVLVRIVT
jgi:hypothetical protein